MTVVISILTTIATLGVTWFLARNKLLAEFKLENAVERSLRKFLEVEKYRLRSFDTLKRHLGGFSDDELRKHLVRAGAIRFYNDEEELWGLLSRNIDQL